MKISILTLFILLSSFSNEESAFQALQPNDVPGKWIVREIRDGEPEKPENLIVEFFADGRMVTTEEGETETGTWKKAGQTIILILDSEQLTIKYHFENRMLILDVDGEVILLERIR